HMAARMAGTMPYLERKIADTQVLAVFKVSSDLGRRAEVHAQDLELFRLHSKQQGLLRQSIIKVFIVFVKQDLGIGKLLVDRSCPANVVEVPMGQHDRIERKYIIPNEAG